MILVLVNHVLEQSNLKYPIGAICVYASIAIVFVAAVFRLISMEARNAELQHRASKFEIPSGIADEMPDLFRDWSGGKIIERKVIHVFRDPLCVEIVRDYSGAVYGFATMKFRTGPLAMNSFEYCSIYDVDELKPNLVLVVIRKPEYLRLPQCKD